MTPMDYLRLATLLVSVLALRLMWTALQQTHKVAVTVPRNRRWRLLPRFLLLFDGAFCVCVLLILSNLVGLPKSVALASVAVSGALLVALAALAAFSLPRLRELEAQAMTDGLTKLFNRRYADVALEREVERWRRYRVLLTCLMIDIDYFKSINDHYGHLVGDVVLKEIGRILKESVRTSDIVGRYGGEEFIILMTDTHPQQGRRLAERLRARIADVPIVLNQGGKRDSDADAMAKRLHLTVSIGVYGLTQERDNISGHHVVARADDALYQAKRNGRNCVVSYIDGLEAAGQQLRAG